MTYSHNIKVRYAETDNMGHAHHSSYAIWLEEARIEALRSIDLSYKELELSGTLMPVVSINISYKKPVFFDDVIELKTKVEKKGRTSLLFMTDIFKDGVLCAKGEVTIVCVDKEGKIKRIPKEIV